MSKYIRTKDNIYKESDLFKIDDKRMRNGYLTKECKLTTAIQESDNIHDLIDRYIAESKHADFNDFFCYDNINEMMEGSEFRDVPEQYNFYAAIYVKGKGLINFARINDKGEVEF